MAILEVSEATFVAENCCIFFDKMCDIFQFIGEFRFVKNADFNSCSFLKQVSKESFSTICQWVSIRQNVDFNS